jgi:hypothetical protein
MRTAKHFILIMGTLVLLSAVASLMRWHERICAGPSQRQSLTIEQIHMDAQATENSRADCTKRLQDLSMERQQTATLKREIVKLQAHVESLSSQLKGPASTQKREQKTSDNEEAEQDHVCLPQTSAATPLRMCLRSAACTEATRMANAGDTISPMLSSFCPENMRRQTVTMVWLTDASTFDIHNQYSLESLLRHHPCAHVQIVAPLLPKEFFLTFNQLGYNITRIHFNAETFEPFTPAKGAPGDAWVRKLQSWKKGPHFATDKEDMLRMLIMHSTGGSYMGFSHIVLRPMLHISNGIGSEICHTDNPDCLSARQIERLEVAVPGSPVQWFEQLGSQYSDRAAFRRRAGLRYTPITGVLINWKPRHSLFSMMLRSADLNYDPQCWGCLGPRLLGKVLLRTMNVSHHLATIHKSFTLLNPGMLYAFSYEVVKRHMQFEVKQTDQFVHNTSCLGMDFFGQSSSNVPLVEHSTMHKFTSQNTLFGADPDLWLVRKTGRAWCQMPRTEAIAKHAMSEGLSSSVMKHWIRKVANDEGFVTFPKNALKFAVMARQAKGILMCHPEWLGIREMTLKIGRVMRLPVVMVADMRPPALHRKLEMLLRSTEVSALIVQGIPPGTFALARMLRARRVASVGVVYHSGVSVHNVAVGEAGLIGLALQSAQAGDISLAFIENDQADWVQHLAVPACSIPSTFKPYGGFVKSLPRGSERLRIGLLGASTRVAVKNFFTQLSAACMIPGAEVHVSSLPFEQLRLSWHHYCVGNIIVRGMLPSDQFTKALGEMHVNLYVSWTDAVPNVVPSSLARGVPVITSDTSPWFDSSPRLKSLLVEPRSDDPRAIYRRMMRVLAFVADHRATFLSDVAAMLSWRHTAAMASWTCFIDGLAAGNATCTKQDGTCTAIRLNPADQHQQEQSTASKESDSLLNQWQHEPILQEPRRDAVEGLEDDFIDDFRGIPKPPKQSPKCEDKGASRDYCTDWCNNEWGCGVATHDDYTCDCTGCNGCRAWMGR